MAGSHRDVVERATDAYNRQDAEALIAVSDADVELAPMRALLDGDPYRGHDGVRRFLAEIREEWEDLRIEVDELREIDGDRVLVVGRFRARGRASRVTVDVPAAWLVEFRGDKIASLRAYSQQAAAFEELGLDR